MLEQLLTSPKKPKIVDPKTHAVLDYLTISAFMLLGSVFWKRKKRAAALALANGFMVLGVSMFTDYPGSLRRAIRFVDHGKLDCAQAALAAIGPTLLGFGGGAAVPFRLQAMNEAMVIGITDWGRERGREALPSRRRA